MAEKLKRWRHCHAQVRALAEKDSGDEFDIAADSSDEPTEDTRPAVEFNYVDDGACGINPDEVDAHNDGGEDSEVDAHNNGGEDSDENFDVYDAIMTSDSDNDGVDEIAAHVDVGNLDDDIRSWATRNACTRTALNEMLGLLRRHGHRLPKDARTLLHTPRVVESIAKCGGQFVYFGIESGILRDIELYQGDVYNLKLNINIDGVPLFKSTNVQFWPILCAVNLFEPFVVALFCGKGKPVPVHEYLEEFIQEAQQLINVGITHNNVHFNVSFTAFICDAPARSYLKCVKGHTAYYSCERCVVKGAWSGRVVFNDDEEHDLRTQNEFDNQQYQQHQVARSPLIDIGISCIHQFPLDYMHLVCLGVVKRLLSFLTGSKGKNDCRLSQGQKTLISERLIRFSGSMPSEFARQPRALSEVDRWKATEFRQFLLYTGPVALHGIVKDEIYDHFLTLSIAISILLEADDDKRRAYMDYATELLAYFVRKCKDIYGDLFTVYNVHHLLHLHQDARHFNVSLNDISAFPFENYLQRIKKLVRNAQNPVAQAVKRISEIERAHSRKIIPKKIAFVSTKEKDCCFLLRNEKIAFLKEKRRNGDLVCDVVSLAAASDFFESPCNSKLLNIVRIRDVVLRNRNRECVLREEDLMRKAVCLPHRDGKVVFPLLHGNERH